MSGSKVSLESLVGIVNLESFVVIVCLYLELVIYDLVY